MSPLLDNYLKRFADFWWEDRGFSAFLLVLLLLFFLFPFVGSDLADLLLSIFFILLLISGAATVTDRRFLRVVVWIVAGSALVSKILHHFIPSRGHYLLVVPLHPGLFFPLYQLSFKADLPAGPGNQAPDPGCHWGLPAHWSYVEVYL
ncbi:MAG TPA: hypothetical protein DCP92_23315 [Nitrospiraceae bacterium]|nr:hypothetical protein [Nitrospiraceae bacterium]